MRDQREIVHDERTRELREEGKERREESGDWDKRAEGAQGGKK